MMAPARATLHSPYRNRVSLAAGPLAAAQARRHVGAVIEAWRVLVDPYVAVLLTSELVTNAIQHDPGGQQPIQLVIAWAANELCVEVHDGSRAAPVPADAPPDAGNLPRPDAAGQPVQGLGLPGNSLSARPSISRLFRRRVTERWRKVREFGVFEFAIMDVVWAGDRAYLVREVRERYDLQP